MKKKIVLFGSVAVVLAAVAAFVANKNAPKEREFTGA